uniref:Uncharacterized protein n=1 Tax=Physcomitrium patens TaxID=3218 RepID=A0A2K1K9W5_PHYPA|nr:hypothetical protein PHYPA_009759 [Physcomitrium patens]
MDLVSLHHMMEAQQEDEGMNRSRIAEGKGDAVEKSSNEAQQQEEVVVVKKEDLSSVLAPCMGVEDGPVGGESGVADERVDPFDRMASQVAVMLSETVPVVAVKAYGCGLKTKKSPPRQIDAILY